MSTDSDRDPTAVGEPSPSAPPPPQAAAQATPPPPPQAEQSASPSAPPKPTPTPPPGLSLIDLAMGVCSLAVRVSLIPVHVAARVAHGPGPTRLTEGAIDDPGPTKNPLADWSAWAVRSVAQVGRVERGRVRNTARSLVGSVTSAIAADPDIGRMVRELAGSQLDPILDEALPRVLDRLAEDPVAVRRIVQDQSVGIMSEAADSARGTTRHADQAVDNLVAKLLHRRSQTSAGNGAIPDLDPNADPLVAPAPDLARDAPQP